MEVDMGSTRYASYGRVLERLAEVAREVPVTISHEGGEVVAEAMHLTTHRRTLPLKVPGGSSIEIHDASMCEYWEGEGQTYETLPAVEYDGVIRYLRPASRTGSKNLMHHFPVIFE